MEMSNADIVRDQYAAVNERDWARAMSHYADEVVMKVPGGIRSGTFRGAETVGTWFADWFSSFERGALFEISEIRSLDDGRVEIVARHEAIGRASGIEVSGTVVWRYTVRDGKITFLEAIAGPGDLGPS